MGERERTRQELEKERPEQASQSGVRHNQRTPGTLHIFIMSPGLSSLLRLSCALFPSTSYLEVALGQQHLEQTLPGLPSKTDITRSKRGCACAEGREGGREGWREGMRATRKRQGKACRGKVARYSALPWQIRTADLASPLLTSTPHHEPQKRDEHKGARARGAPSPAHACCHPHAPTRARASVALLTLLTRDQTQADSRTCWRTLSLSSTRVTRYRK